MNKARVGVLISGRGSNMMALVEGSKAPNSSYQIICVVSNTADAAGIPWAAARGIVTHVLSHRGYSSREDFDAELKDYLQSQHLDLIACAGFMRVMTPVLIAPWRGRMLNIHPSLLPLYKGLHTHERAIADKQVEAGCTVHLVTQDLDGGPIIAQARVPVLLGDTAETLAARVLVQEHKLYPATLNKVAQALIDGKPLP